MTTRFRAAAVVAVVLGAGTSACGSGSPMTQPNSVDIGFAQDMSVHHEQAVQMSQLALRFGTGTLRDLVMAILVSQSQELGAMRGWLRVWNQPATNPKPMSWTPGMQGMSGMAMPGMATPAQMLQLYNARGKAFDVLYAKLMVAHHVGGIAMDQAAIDAHASALVADLAAQEKAEQYSDLGLLRTLLNANCTRS